MQSNGIGNGNGYPVDKRCRVRKETVEKNMIGSTMLKTCSTSLMLAASIIIGTSPQLFPPCNTIEGGVCIILFSAEYLRK